MKSIYESEDFACPETGYGVCLVWDSATGLLEAKLHDGGVWKKYGDMDSERIVRNKTFAWCEAFNLKEYTAEDLDAANEIAEIFDTWFL